MAGVFDIQEGETVRETALRNEQEAPNGRCGETQVAEMQGYQGCGQPLLHDGALVCDEFPDCCRP